MENRPTFFWQCTPVDPYASIIDYWWETTNAQSLSVNLEYHPDNQDFRRKSGRISDRHFENFKLNYSYRFLKRSLKRRWHEILSLFCSLPKQELGLRKLLTWLHCWIMASLRKSRYNLALSLLKLRRQPTNIGTLRGLFFVNYSGQNRS